MSAAMAAAEGADPLVRRIAAIGAATDPARRAELVGGLSLDDKMLIVREANQTSDNFRRGLLIGILDEIAVAERRQAIADQTQQATARAAQRRELLTDRLERWANLLLLTRALFLAAEERPATVAEGFLLVAKYCVANTVDEKPPTCFEPEVLEQYRRGG